MSEKKTSRGTRKDGVCRDCGTPTRGYGGTVDGTEYCDDCFDLREEAAEKKPKLDEMGCGGAGSMGYQLPLGAEEDKKDLPEHVEKALRLMIRGKIEEVVRRKDNKYVLYAPNKGKKKKAKPIRSFSSKLAAKRAELAQFPPEDPNRAKKLRREVDKLTKSPKKAAEKERKEKTRKTESIEDLFEQASCELLEAKILGKIVKNEVRQHVLGESLFREDAPTSEWDEYIKKIGDRALGGDKTFQRYHGAIQKASEGLLVNAAKSLAKSVRAAGGKVTTQGTKKHEDGRAYLQMSIEADNVEIAPVYLYVENGQVQVEFSDTAQASLTKTQPQTAQLIRGELARISQEGEGRDIVQGAIQKRDAYLQRIEKNIDRMLASMNPVQISVLKQMLVKKYRRGL